jgi:uncharacterized protein (DUF2267 family)
MNAAFNEIFSKTLDKTHIWLTDLMQELDWTDEHKAYLALRAVLHTLRDRLTVEEAADLAAQLPMLVRGFYFEGWHPAGTPVKERHQKQFLDHVRDYFKNDDSVVPEKVVRAVFKLLRRRVSRGEVKDIGQILPGEVRVLWS